MHEHPTSHRFSNYEENVAFTNEDGIDVFRPGARFQQCLCFGESDILVGAKEIIKSYVSEKRKHPQSLKDFSVMDLL